MQITVIGIPAPKGSKRHMGKGIMIESSNKVAPWIEAVKWACVSQSGGQRFKGPVVVRVEYLLVRPQRAKAGAVPDKKPDLDKLQRSTFDALTQSGLIEDDARIVETWARKRYAQCSEMTGAVITVEAA